MIVTEFPRPIREIEHIMIPLSDGAQLAARLWLPCDAEQDPVPAILEYLPYRKRDGTYERDALTHPYLAGHGYGCARVDIRGTGESDGLLFDEYTKQEQDDALEVIAWLAAQSWCSGSVGMMGISWGGFNALQVAARRPVALKAIITICSTDDRYRDDVHFMGGALLSATFGWAAFFFGAMCRPPDPALVDTHWLATWQQRLDNVPMFLETWIRHQRRDAYWKHGSVCEDYGLIQCPVYAVGGWTDGYTNAIPRLLANLTVPRKGLIGPWAHNYPHFALPGPQVDFLQEALRWWDCWLKGIDTGVMTEPMLRAWMTGDVQPASYHDELPGHWITEPSWPPAGIISMRLYLANEGLQTQGGIMQPRNICTPLTVGSCAGSWCPFGRTKDQAGDQRNDDAQSVVFETAPLDEPVAILGAPVVTLDFTCDRPLGILIVRLCDVRPDGATQRISYGVMNLTHRHGDDTPEPMLPGHCYRVSIRLNAAGSVFSAAHRIRLALSTTYWPMIWPSPEQATVTLLGGLLDLPVRPTTPADALVTPLAEPQHAPPEPTSILNSGATRIDRIGLELATDGCFELNIKTDDPLSATAEMRQTQFIARDDWQTRIDTQIRLSCTFDAFRIQAAMKACNGKVEICSRTWDLVIPREFV